MSHALLSPSGASRWLACTPSARLEAQYPDTSGAAAKEGTVAHALGELLIRYKRGEFNKYPLSPAANKKAFEKELEKITASEYYNESMHEYADAYATYVMEHYAAAQERTPDAAMFLEHRLDMTEYVPEGFGTGDTVLIADGILDLIDLKYGKGVPVSSEQNKQLMLYGLGALRDFDFMYDIQTVRLHIFQPRIDNSSVWEISVAELKTWAVNELMPKAELAFKGEGEFKPGAHCRFCKARAVCRANAEYNLEVAKYEFAEPPTLNDEEIADIMHRADGFINWLKAVDEHALREALAGKKWPGWKLVEGRSVRKYSDETAVITKLKDSGVDEDKMFAPRELLGITKLEKSLGKTYFNQVVNPLLVKPPGKPTLAPESDKRQELNSAEAAAADFEGIEADE